MGYVNKLNNLGITRQTTGKQLCPWCSSGRKSKSEPCLSVTYNNNGVIYNCHNCQRKGFVPYKEQERPKKQYLKPILPTVETSKDKIYKYFKARGISGEIIDKYKIEYNGKEILFPYYKNNELVNIKYRDGNKRFRQEANTEKTFFGMDKITDFGGLIMVEGELDVLTLAEVGIESVSVPQGATEEKLECIDNCWDWLEKFDYYVIASDNDDAGNILKNNLLNRLDRYKCKLVDYKDWKDANEVLVGDKKKGVAPGGRECLIDIIQSAQLIKNPNIITVFDIYDKLYNLRIKNFITGMSTGWGNLDKVISIHTGYIMIVTGIPSRGKSFFVDNLLYNLTEKHKLSHLLISFENSDENHFARFIEFYKNKKLEDLDDYEYNEGVAWVNDYFYRLNITEVWDIDGIIQQIEYTIRRHGIKTVVIDPYDRIDHNFSDREDLYIKKILNKLTALCKKFNILLVFIVHPRKINEKPTMYDVTGSAGWYNAADYAIIVHRDREKETGQLSNKLEITIAKVKYRFMGNTSGGEIYLKCGIDGGKITDWIENKYKGNYIEKEGNYD